MKNSESEDEDVHFKKGKELPYKSRPSIREIIENPKKALKEFDKIIKKNPNFAAAYFHKGNALHTLGEKEKSILFYDKALELDPSNASYFIAKSFPLMELGKYEEAIQSCHQALKLEPNCAWLTLALVYCNFKKFEEALDCIEKHLISEPDDEFSKPIKHVIVDGLKFGEYYYVPINTYFRDEIPYEDTILYTTTIKIKTSTQIFIWQAIITDKGIRTRIPHTGIRTISWDKISFKSNKSFTFSGFKCELHWDPRYETKKEFNDRSKHFRETINQLRAKFLQ